MPSGEPLDPAAIVADHCRYELDDQYCQECSNRGRPTLWPCLPYRLAAENVRLAAQLAHIASTYLSVAAQVEAVRALHVYTRLRGSLWGVCSMCGSEWPCPTIAALDAAG